MRPTSFRLSFLLTLLLPAATLGAQGTADSSFARAVSQIRAIDNHTHAVRMLAPGDTVDPDIDALVCPSDEASPPPGRVGAGHPMIRQAWRAIYGYPYDDASPAHLAELPALRARAWAAHPGTFPVWLLDQIGTETAFANRVAMGPGLEAPRYRWVPFVDALVFPLDTRTLRTTPDRVAFFAAEARHLDRYRQAAKLPRLPATLDGYVNDFVAPTLQRMKREGAVSVKFELAYLRSLDVAPSPHDVAARTYARFVAGGAAPYADYRVVQDYLLRAIVREAGRLGLPVQFHTGGGCGGYFDLAGSAPSRLSSLIDDPAMRGTRFVLLHGGGSYMAETGYMITKNNVWADISEYAFANSPRTLAGIIRPWLESAPDKVLFGTDFYPWAEGSDGSEIAWLTANTNRQAITRALEELMADGEISRDRALEIARMVLRDNAISLYRLAPGSAAR
jgi:predicted TIM-barrel fold metal-dependent hydrolase